MERYHCLIAPSVSCFTPLGWRRKTWKFANQRRGYAHVCFGGKPDLVMGRSEGLLMTSMMKINDNAYPGGQNRCILSNCALVMGYPRLRPKQKL